MQVDGFRFDLMGHIMKRTMVWQMRYVLFVDLIYRKTEE